MPVCLLGNIEMKKLVLISAVLALYGSVATAQVSGSQALGQSAADAGAMAQTGAITFEASQPLESQRIHTTPSVYVPPSMFGGANNCGQSNTAGVGVTGFTIGGSVASESDACNAREDTAVTYRLGYKDVAEMRFFCFGIDQNRMAWEATGRKCPATATAKGLQPAATSAGRTDNFGFPVSAGG